MSHFNNLNVLPFYTDLKYQNKNKWYAFGSMWGLASPTNSILPFQLSLPYNLTSVELFQIKNAEGKVIYSPSTKPSINNSKFSTRGYSVVKLVETTFSDSYNLPIGTYYIEMQLKDSADSTYTYYSEMFTVVNNISDFLKIQYWNDDNMYYSDGEINYEDNFKFTMYLCTTIGKPEYEFEEELTKRGGYPFLESQISSKLYKFAFIAPEFICDAMRLIRMSDYIRISSNGLNYNALTFSYEPNWEDQGDLASVQAEFTVDDIIQKLASFNRRVKESFYNALLADVNEPMMFDAESIAQHYKSALGGATANLVNGLLIRELEELKAYKQDYYAVLDTGEGAAKKILLSNLLAGIAGNIDTSNFVTTDQTEQSIFGVKTFLNGLAVGNENKIKVYEKDGALFIDGNVAVTGALTLYADGTQNIGTIYDGLPIDNDTIYWETTEGGSRVLKAKGGGGEAGSVQWANISGKPVWIGDTKPSYNWSEIQGEKPFYTKEEADKRYVTINTEQEITALKHFKKGLSIGEAKKLIYEEDGVLFIDANVAVTGALTMYATGPQSVGSIYDGLPIDNETIYWEASGDSRKLVAKVGSGSSFDENAMWNALSGSSDKQINKSHLTTALTGYATESWVTSKNYAVKATTLAGYGITDAYTRTESDGKYPTKTGSGASGTWGINVTGNAGTATKLQTARSLWGNNFDGTANISGDITLAIGKGIYLSANDERWLLQTKRSDNTQINGIKTNGFQMCTYFGDTKTMQFSNDRIYSYVDFRAERDLYINGIRLHKTADGVITLEGNLAVTGGITMYAIDPVSASTIMDGVVVDGTTIKKENGKLVAVGGGEAGSVAWGNISGKPSVFATNIANITDLHSSWDSVLAAQKPNWLTAVSIATISDLHANWDALLKAAPSAYVTRWPTISEVTGKQNLIIKLNGGTTEGTNQFTYNATAAKSLNITASSVGAATSGHTHTVIKNNLMLKGSNGKSDSAGITLALGDSDTGFKWISDGAVQIYANNTAIGQWNSSGMNWLKAPKVNGKKIWYEDNDGSGSGLNADLLDNVHLSGIVHSEQGYSTGTTDATGSSSNLTRSGFWRDNNKSRIGIFACHSQDANYGWEISCPYNEIRAYLRVKSNGYWIGERALACLDDNVYSATKLQNYRRIWGQSFNGEQDVVGSLTNVTSITASDKVEAVKFETSASFTTGTSTSSIFNDSSSLFGTSYNYASVGLNTVQPVLRWGNAISGQGFQTKYIIGSARTSYDFGYIYMAISNNDNATSEGCSFIIHSSGYVKVNGNFLVSGGGTFYSSDIRYKSIIQQTKLSLSDIAKAPSFVYHWNKEGMKCDRLNLGGSAQYTQSVLPWAVEDNDNFLSMDYATVAYTFAVHTARHLLSYETRTDKKIKKLENRVKYLEKQLKKLGYEEVRTLDDQSV